MNAVARVVLPQVIVDRFTHGVAQVDVEAKDVRGLMKALDARFPGIAAVLEDEMALAMNGAIYHDAFLETVGPETEVCFIPRIGGG